MRTRIIAECKKFMAVEDVELEENSIDHEGKKKCIYVSSIFTFGEASVFIYPLKRGSLR